VKISKAVRKVLCELDERGSSTLSDAHYSARQAIVLWGLAETFVPVAETFVQAHRGRVRYYRLTDAGRQILREGVA
jgi:hypothetical protein